MNRINSLTHWELRRTTVDYRVHCNNITATKQCRQQWLNISNLKHYQWQLNNWVTAFQSFFSAQRLFCFRFSSLRCIMMFCARQCWLAVTVDCTLHCMYCNCTQQLVLQLIITVRFHTTTISLTHTHARLWKKLTPSLPALHIIDTLWLTPQHTWLLQ